MMGDFEKDLRDAFEGVEFTPSERVWDGVQEGLRPKKKRGIFYMWQTYGVAASLAFLLTMGFLLRDELFTNGDTQPETEQLTQNKEEQKTTSEKDNQTDAKANTTEDKPVDEVNSKEQQTAIDAKDLQARTDDTLLPKDENLAISLTEENQVNDLQTRSDALVALTDAQPNAENESLDLSESVEPLGIFDLQASMAAIRNRWELKNLVAPLKLEFGSEEDVPQDISQHQTSLTGSFGGGSFNPNSSLNNAALATAEMNFSDPRFAGAQSLSTRESESQLGSIAVGFGVGLPLGDKWILKTGLRYSQYRFAGTSNAYSVENGQQLPVYSRVTFDNTQLMLAGEYELTNTLHSISIPAQFGFRVLNLNRFSTWVNLGVAADYFISYTVKGDLNFLETRQVDFDEANFLSRFNLNALTGIELAYQLNEKFALSGEVFFRQYVPFRGAESAYDASPSFFGFGLGVNYYLKKKK